MSTIRKCDGCGALETDKGGQWGDIQSSVDPIGAQFYPADLCPDCVRSLSEWWASRRALETNKTAQIVPFENGTRGTRGTATPVTP